MQNNDQQISNMQQGMKQRVVSPSFRAVCCWTLMFNRVFWSSVLMTLFLFLAVGCKVEDKTWIDKMLSETESAWVEAERVTGGQEARVAAVRAAVQKYFPPGMKTEEAFKLLRQLKEQGFEIRETRNQGARAWPDGEFIPYPGEVGKITHQRRYPEGMSEFLARKQYGTQILLLATKHVVISFRVVDGSGVISEVKGDIWASGI